MQAYMFVLCGDYSDSEGTPEEWEAGMAAHTRFTEQVLASGAKIVSGEALDGPGTATTVRNTAGQSVVTDGPFIDTKESIGGFYVIEARDLDHALELAKLVPEPVVEVRPVVRTG